MYPRVFNASELGQSLREVSGEILTAGEKNIINRWFHGPKEVDLFIWTDEHKNILKQQISFYGQVVEWNVIEGLKTGLIIEEESSRDGRVDGSEVVRFDAKAQLTPVEQALELLAHITALSELERSALKSNFAEPDVGTDLPAEEFIRRFGSLVEAKPKLTKSPESNWNRLVNSVARWLKRR